MLKSTVGNLRCSTRGETTTYIFPKLPVHGAPAWWPELLHQGLRTSGGRKCVLAFLVFLRGHGNSGGCSTDALSPPELKKFTGDEPSITGRSEWECLGVVHAEV
eukprot:601996-Amphidinium_carterae.1